MAYLTSATLREFATDIGCDLPTEDSAVERLIARASADIEAYVCHGAPDTGTLAIDTATLTDFQRHRLALAVAAQVAHRLEVEELSKAEGTPTLLGVADLRFSPRRPDDLSPQALVWLAGSGVNRRAGTAQP